MRRSRDFEQGPPGLKPSTEPKRGAVAGDRARAAPRGLRMVAAGETTAPRPCCVPPALVRNDPVPREAGAVETRDCAAAAPSADLWLWTDQAEAESSMPRPRLRSRNSRRERKLPVTGPAIRPGLRASFRRWTGPPAGLRALIPEKVDTGSRLREAQAIARRVAWCFGGRRAGRKKNHAPTNRMDEMTIRKKRSSRSRHATIACRGPFSAHIGERMRLKSAIWGGGPMSAAATTPKEPSRAVAPSAAPRRAGGTFSSS